MPEEGKLVRTDAERLTAVEEHLRRYDGVQERLLGRQLKTITIVFQFVAALLFLITLGTAILSRVDAAQMERRFEALAGRGLPKLNILYDGKDLDGQTITVKLESNHSFTINGLELKNVGDAQSQRPSVRFHFSEPFVLQREGQGLESVPPMSDLKKDFPFSVYWGFTLGTITISPREYWSVDPLVGILTDDKAHEMKAKALVFYGRETPTTADFVIRFVAASKAP